MRLTRLLDLVFVQGLLCVSALCGCGPGPLAINDKPAVADTTEHSTDARQTSAAKSDENPQPAGIQYSNFTLLTNEPFRVRGAAFDACADGVVSIETIKEASDRGPHYVPAVKFFANEAATAQIRNLSLAMPVGATIVKEKWRDENAADPVAYAAMIKREPGYDPRHGDWEYLYVDLANERSTRGRIESCISCHRTAEKRDYLFRGWLTSDQKQNAGSHQDAPERNASGGGPENIPSIDGVDYAAFTSLRKEPLRVSPAAFALCRPPSDSEAERQKARGPHFAPAVKFFANDQALTQLRSGKTSAMPGGATIVKEKWDDERAKTPVAYAAMIKREAGYDPQHSDWEYVYATLNEKGIVERGRLKSCIDCHAAAEKRDYLFRNWLDAKENPESKAEPTTGKGDAEKRAAK